MHFVNLNVQKERDDAKIVMIVTLFENKDMLFLAFESFVWESTWRSVLYRREKCVRVGVEIVID